MAHDLATARTVMGLIDEYDEKAAGIEAAIKAYQDACTAVEMAGCVAGTYIGPVLNGRSYLYPTSMQKNLLQSGWKAIYNRLNIETIATANDKRLFERTLADPPPLTYENAKATFGPYLENPRQHILRGLAETFASLDPAYRSHSKVKIGVKGLPKRVIIPSLGGYGTYGRDKVRDILNALAAYEGKPLLTHAELSILEKDGEALRFGGEVKHPFPGANDPKTMIVIARDIWLKTYGNGNGHLYFGPAALLNINSGLAEFYGDVLPDVEPENAKRAPGTDVAKDLQFYWSPDAVIRKALELARLTDARQWRSNPPAGLKVLEPSCGDGRIMDMVRAYGHKVTGVEYHAGRAAQARAKGHSVVTANFLECPPQPEFDLVVMNPPFYGRHYLKHVRHALKFLKPGGRLVAVLPGTAQDDGELAGTWDDLPIASFAEAGTNVPTVLLKMESPNA